MTLSDAYRILEVDRVAVFAGKQGSEVREHWKVEREGHEYTVLVSPYHTNVAGTPKPFEKGELVRISGKPNHDRIRVTISQVKR